LREFFGGQSFVELGSAVIPDGHAKRSAQIDKVNLGGKTARRGSWIMRPCWC
jgi:hypothetical protein